LILLQLRSIILTKSEGFVCLFARGLTAWRRTTPMKTVVYLSALLPESIRRTFGASSLGRP